MIALLDMQGMQSASRGNGGGGGSELSLTLCDSVASLILCL
jgi:hypothetical protein